MERLIAINIPSSPDNHQDNINDETAYAKNKALSLLLPLPLRKLTLSEFTLGLFYFLLSQI